MDLLVGFLLHPPRSGIAKKLGKILKYNPLFQAAFGTTDRSNYISVFCVLD